MCRKESVEEGLANSDLVFMAEVQGAWRFGLPERILTKVDIELIHIKKGDPSAVPKQLITSNWDGHCGMEILVPARYWFFTDKDGRFNRCTATDLISTERLASLRIEARRGLIAWLRRHAAERSTEAERSEKSR